MKQIGKREFVVGTLVSNIAEAWAKQQKWTDLVLRIKSNAKVNSKPLQDEQPLDEPQKRSLEAPKEEPLEQVSEEDLSLGVDMDTKAVVKDSSVTEMESTTDVDTPEMKVTTEVDTPEMEVTPDVDTSEKKATTNSNASKHDQTTTSNAKTTPNTVEFPCHKFILSGRSPVFRSILESGKVDVVELENITPETVNTLLNFIYTDSVVKKLIDTRLLAAADRFGMDDLKAICCDVLCPSVAVENAIDLFLVARLTKVKTLEERARNFIFDNLSDVMKTPDWEERREETRTVAELVMEAYFSRESCKTDTFCSAAVNSRKRVRNRLPSVSSISDHHLSDEEPLVLDDFLIHFNSSDSE